MALFLVIVGLTGSVLAFCHELDRWLNPELLTVPMRDAPMLNPFTLRERAQALEPRARFDQVSLNQVPGEANSVWLQPKTDPATGKDYALPYNELLLDPYTGERIGSRKWGEVSLAKEDILSFLYRLHMTLALPEATGSLGGYILGITALVWTIDCFVGFYLTLPRRRRKGSHPHPYPPPSAGGQGRELPGSLPCESGGGSGRGWWQRWKPAWLIKRCRFNYDLHRASDCGCGPCYSCSPGRVSPSISTRSTPR